MFFIVKLFKLSLLASVLASFAFGAPLNDLLSLVLREPVNNTKILEARAPSHFNHPGVLLGRTELDFIRSKVKARQEPWNTAFKTLLSSKFASLNRHASPRANVNCGFYDRPSYGCADERIDALAAYGTSLVWYVTGDKKYAQKAIYYMNRWSQTIKTHTGDNAPIQAGWAGASWTRAAEIIRYTDAGWASKDISAFRKMLRKAYQPLVMKGSKNNGNWELVMMEAGQGIAIFLDDRANYDKAMQKFLRRVPAYVYLRSDGPYPIVAPPNNLHTPGQIETYWHGQTQFLEDGIGQETCRDFSHMGSGLSSIAHVADTSRIQGQDLFEGDVGHRLRLGLEFHSRHQLDTSKPPAWLCGGHLNRVLGPITEVGYNNLAVRLGHKMPHTKSWTKDSRPVYTNWLDAGFETLTHARGKL